jgi:Phage protein Gp138 N-terminal domain
VSGEDTPKFWQVLQAAVESGTRGLRTGLPGVFQSYDKNANRATVQALIPDAFYGEDGSREAQPIAIMTDVPVAQIGTGKVRIRFPIKKGDPCWLMFSSSCLVGWKQAGARIVDPQDDRRHHEADVVAWPSVFIDPTDDDAMIEFTDDGHIKAGGNEPLVTKADFDAHVHTSAASGSPTSPPTIAATGTSKLRG